MNAQLKKKKKSRELHCLRNWLGREVISQSTLKNQTNRTKIPQHLSENSGLVVQILLPGKSLPPLPFPNRMQLLSPSCLDVLEPPLRVGRRKRTKGLLFNIPQRRAPLMISIQDHHTFPGSLRTCWEYNMISLTFIKNTSTSLLSVLWARPSYSWQWRYVGSTLKQDWQESAAHFK